MGPRHGAMTGCRPSVRRPGADAARQEARATSGRFVPLSAECGNCRDRLRAGPHYVATRHARMRTPRENHVSLARGR